MGMVSRLWISEVVLFFYYNGAHKHDDAQRSSIERSRRAYASTTLIFIDTFVGVWVLKSFLTHLGPLLSPRALQPNLYVLIQNARSKKFLPGGGAMFFPSWVRVQQYILGRSDARAIRQNR